MHADTPGHADATLLFQSYWEAEQRREPAEVVEHYTPDGAFVDRLGRVIGGREALLRFYAASAAAFPRARVDPLHIVQQGDRAAAQYEAHLWDADGVERCARVAVFAEIQDGRFRRLESFFDPAQLDA
jgi:ketosteroid isomerase-like protein